MIKTFFFILFYVIQGQNNNFTLNGIVTDSDKHGIQDVHIFIENTNIGTKTDSRGYFTLNNVKPGQISLIARHVGFEEKRLTIDFNRGSTDDIRIILKVKIFQENDLVVTAEYQKTSIRNSLRNTTVVTEKSLEEKGISDVSELMNTMMNTRVINDEVLGSNVILQGMSGENVKILLDGVPLINGEGSQFDLKQLNLDQIQQVEVIYGPASVEYGSNALAGTINLIRKKTDSLKQFNLSSKISYENVGKYLINSQFSHFNSGHSYSLNLNYDQFNGLSTLGQERANNWIPSTKYFGNFDYSYRNSKNEFNFNHYHNLNQQESLGEPIHSSSYSIATDRLTDITRQKSNLVYKRLNKGGTSFQALVSYQSYRKLSNKYLVNLKDNSRKKTDDPQDHDRSNYNSIYSRATFNDKMFSSLSYQIGYEVNAQLAEGERIHNGKNRLNDFGFFYSNKYDFNDQFAIQGSVRYIYNDQFDAKNIDFLNLKLPIISSILSRYRLSEKINLKLSYARGFRAPSLKELYFNFHDANHSIDGNPNLNSELANNYQFNIDFISGFSDLNYKLTANLFLNNVQNKIYLLNKLTIDPADLNKVAKTYFNIEDFRTRGYNLKFDLQLSRRFNSSLNYSYLERSGTHSKGRKFKSYEFAANFSYRENSGYVFSLNLKHHGEIAQFSLLDGKLVTRKLAPYSFLDFSLNKSVFDKMLNLHFSVKNILNVQNVEQSGNGKDGLLPRSGFKRALALSWGRTYLLSTKWQFDF